MHPEDEFLGGNPFSDFAFDCKIRNPDFPIERNLRQGYRDPISVALFDRVALFSDFNCLFENRIKVKKTAAKTDKTR